MSWLERLKRWSLANDGRNAAVLVLSVVSLAPVLVTPIVPLTDLGSTVGASGLLLDTAFGKAPIADLYFVNPNLVPYWTGYVFLALVGVVVGPVMAAKCLVAVCVIAMPLSLLRLARALGRDWALVTFGFVLAWDLNLYWGWVTFHLGMSVAVWALALLIEADSWKAAARLIPLTALVALTHAHAVVLLTLAALLTAFGRARPFRAVALHLVSCLGFLVLSPWLWSEVLKPKPGSGPMSFVSPPVNERISRVFEHALGYFVDQPGLALVSAAFLVILGVTLFGSALLPRGNAPRPALVLGVVVTPLLLYLFLPFEVRGPVPHWWTYPRFATLVLGTLLLVPNVMPSLRARWGLVAGAFVVTFALSAVRFSQFSLYGAHVRPYLELVEQIPPGSRFLPLDLEIFFPGFREPSLGQLHGYAAAARHSYDPHLFDHGAMPLLYRPNVQPPTPDWYKPQTSYTSAMAQHYDYVLITPPSRDFLPTVEPRVLELVGERGAWRLYRVLKPAP